MAVTRVTTAALQAVSNQVLTQAGALDTEGAGRPCSLTSIVIKKHKSQSARRYIQLFNAALSSDVTLGATAPDLVLPIDTVAVDGKVNLKAVFPNGGIHFPLGLQCAITTTSTGAVAAATTTLPEEVLFFWSDKQATGN